MRPYTAIFALSLLAISLEVNSIGANYSSIKQLPSINHQQLLACQRNTASPPRGIGRREFYPSPSTLTV